MIQINVKAVVPERTVEAAQGWVLYDGDCSLCAAAAARFAPMLHRHHFNLALLQTPWVRQRLGLTPNALLIEMKLLAADGRIYGGADALLQIARTIWWVWPVYALAQIPGAMVLIRAVYRVIAKNRHCLNGACLIQKQLARRHTTRVFFEMP